MANSADPDQFFVVFFYFLKKISLEISFSDDFRCGGSNEYPQSMF